MAAYSGKSDVKDAILAGVSQEQDHVEAEREINRELRRRGVDPESIDDPDFLKDMSISYACMKRCLYEMRGPDDAFSAKIVEYRRQWDTALGKLDGELAKGEVDLGGISNQAFRPITLLRG